MAAQALRRYVSTPLDNLACLAISVHLQRWPRRYDGYVPATSAREDVTLRGRTVFLTTIWSDSGLYSFLAADPAETFLDFFWT